ncbi:hypothetical protein EGR_10475 [Echinococcus granulosus]|uniref:Uncharacterized protein n=1 Tax=Echinococcus granulosus TaxID=6210 RepID=W6U8B3_ECHGR|nr:hypothetical protein EGR_10475 [Echinococcus granulosus]EUB54657.1 hypothetical protein EGR_10475 [Echinococcus granulosus]
MVNFRQVEIAALRTSTVPAESSNGIADLFLIMAIVRKLKNDKLDCFGSCNFYHNFLSLCCALEILKHIQLA